MSRIYFLQNGNANLKTGGYIFNKNLINGLKDNGLTVTLISIQSENDSESILQEFNSICASLPKNSLIFIDGLIGAFLSEGILKFSVNFDFYYILHLPQMNSANADEMSALKYSKGIISTAKYTTNLLEELGITSEKALTLEPAPNLFELKANFPDTPRNLLMVGSVVERKGVMEVIEILSKIDTDWELNLVGEIAFEPDYLIRVHNLLKELNLENRVNITGPQDLEYLKEAYKSADLFITASNDETYGMALWDAVYSGLPIAVNDIPAHRINFKLLDIEFFNISSTEKAIIYFQTLFSRPGFSRALAQSKKNAISLNINTWNTISIKLIKWLRNG